MKPKNSDSKTESPEIPSTDAEASGTTVGPAPAVSQSESVFRLDNGQFEALLNGLNRIADRLDNNSTIWDAVKTERAREKSATPILMSGWMKETHYDSPLIEFQAVPQGQGFPPTLAFLIHYCSTAEGRAVGENEVLNTLHNVRIIHLNATINEIYHQRAHVALYPGNRPDFGRTLRGAAWDIKKDLQIKGVIVTM